MDTLLYLNDLKFSKMGGIPLDFLLLDFLL